MWCATYKVFVVSRLCNDDRGAVNVNPPILTLRNSVKNTAANVYMPISGYAIIIFLEKKMSL